MPSCGGVAPTSYRVGVAPSGTPKQSNLCKFRVLTIKYQIDNDIMELFTEEQIIQNRSNAPHTRIGRFNKILGSLQIKVDNYNTARTANQRNKREESLAKLLKDQDTYTIKISE